jgi:hypothetical protein
VSRLPLPPAAAVLRPLLRPHEDIAVLSASTRLVRVFVAAGRHQQRWNTFRHTGPLPHARFDPHPPSPNGKVLATPTHGVLYFGLSVRTSIAEVFQDSSIVDRTTRRPHLAVFSPTRPLRLLDLTGLWPTRAGASQEISSGHKDITQAWARAIREAFPELDGLWYRSSMDSGDPAVCLWHPPSGDALPLTPDVLVPLDYPGLDLPLARICDSLNYVLN